MDINKHGTIRHQESEETCHQQSQQLDASYAGNCDANFHEIDNQTRHVDVTSRQTPLFSNDMINVHIKSLNEEKRKVFDVLQKWSDHKLFS